MTGEFNISTMDKEKNPSGMIPEHREGKEINTESTAELNSADEAKRLFSEAKQRLLNVNLWHEIAGTPSATFQLTDKEGREVNRTVEEGDHFKINIPGPGSVAGDGYDWVRVEEIKTREADDAESIGIRVRPAANPTTGENEIAHFYSEESTSNFIVTREGKKVTAGIYDRNTKPNTDANLLDKARDMVIGLSAVAGFSKFQWQKLADGLIEKHSTRA